MAIVKIIKEGQLLESTNENHIYPVTVFEAVIDKDNKNLQQIVSTLNTQILRIEGKAVEIEESLEQAEGNINNCEEAVKAANVGIQNMSNVVENINNTTSAMYNIKGAVKALGDRGAAPPCVSLLAQPTECSSIGTPKEKDLYFLSTPGYYTLSEDRPITIETLHMAVYQNGTWQYLDLGIPLIPSTNNVAEGSVLKCVNGKLTWSEK